MGFYNNEYKYNEQLINNIERYNELEEQYKDDAQGIENFEKELEEYINIYYMYIVDDNNVVQNEDKIAVDKFNNSIYAKDIRRLNIDAYLVQLLNRQIQYVNSYEDYLKSVEEDKNILIKTSIFHKKGSFSYNNIIKTADDFKKLEGIETKTGIEKGIESISSYFIADIIIILLIIILSITIFSQERENETLMLLKANKKGRAPLIITKLLTLMIIVVAVIITIYTIVIAIANSFYGFGDLNRSIQSISTFRTCNLIISVKQYLILFITLKIITSIIISAIVALIIQCTKNITKSYVALIGFIFISFICYKYIAFNSNINALKYINIFSFLSVENIIGKYTNINLFTKPINIIYIYKVVTSIILPIILAITIIMFEKEREVKGRKINIRVLSKIKEKISKVTIPSTLFLNEAYKLIIENKSYLIIAIVFAIAISSLNINEKKNYDNDTIIYKNYIKKLEGPLDIEKEEYLENEKNSFDNIEQQCIESSILLQEGKITKDEYEVQEIKLDMIKIKQKAFNKVYDQYNYLKTLQSDMGIKGSFVDKGIEDNLFNLKNELNRGIYLSFIIIIILSNVFAKEYRTEAIKLITVSKERRKVFIYKYLISMLMTILVFILIYLPNYINVINEFDTEFLKFPIQSLQQYMNVKPNLSIVQFIILENIFKLLGVISIAIVILGISTSSKNHITTIIISTILLMPAAIMRVMGVSLSDKITLSNIFGLNHTLSLKEGISFNLVYFITILIISLGFLYITFKKFENKKLINREVKL